MKTMIIERTADDRAERLVRAPRPTRAELRRESSTKASRAIEAQLAEFQSTFSTRWEW
jgi:hypothetical protein